MYAREIATRHIVTIGPEATMTEGTCVHRFDLDRVTLCLRVRARGRPEGIAPPVKIVFIGLLVITSLLLILLILLHKGKGGGLSDMFGGGISSSLGGSSIAERNLDRITIAIGILWAASIIGLGLLAKAAV